MVVPPPGRRPSPAARCSPSRSPRTSSPDRNAVDQEPAMSANPTLAKLDQRIALIRQNIRELIEQAAAFSGAGDEARVADRIAEQEEELAKLTKMRDALSRKYRPDPTIHDTSGGQPFASPTPVSEWAVRSDFPAPGDARCTP